MILDFIKELLQKKKYKKFITIDHYTNVKNTLLKALFVQNAKQGELSLPLGNVYVQMDNMKIYLLGRH